jgi:hypothetical protein
LIEGSLFGHYTIVEHLGAGEYFRDNMDVFHRLPAGDLVQASAIVASVVYHAATREEMLPRKPLPKPQQPRVQGGARSRGAS